MSIVKDVSRKIHFQYNNQDYSADTVKDIHTGIMELLKEDSHKFNYDNIKCDFGMDFLSSEDDDEDDFKNKRLFSDSLNDRNVKALINVSDRINSSIIYCETQESLQRYYMSKHKTYRGAIGEDFEHAKSNKILTNRQLLKPVYLLNFPLLPGIFVQQNNYETVLLNNDSRINILVKITNQRWIDNNISVSGAFHNEFKQGDYVYIVLPIDIGDLTRTTIKEKLFEHKLNIVQSKQNVEIKKFEDLKYLGKNTKKISIYISGNISHNISMPENLETLNLYNESSLPLYLPEKLKYLHIHLNNFNEPLNNLPKKLKELHIDSIMFNQPLDNLPKTLKELYVESYNFNQPLDNLPKTLESILINSPILNYPINNLPTKNIKYIEIKSLVHNLNIDNES